MRDQIHFVSPEEGKQLDLNVVFNQTLNQKPSRFVGQVEGIVNLWLPLNVVPSTRSSRIIEVLDMQTRSKRSLQTLVLNLMQLSQDAFEFLVVRMPPRLDQWLQTFVRNSGWNITMTDRSDGVKNYFASTQKGFYTLDQVKAFILIQESEDTRLLEWTKLQKDIAGFRNVEYIVHQGTDKLEAIRERFSEPSMESHEYFVLMESNCVFHAGFEAELKRLIGIKMGEYIALELGSRKDVASTTEHVCIGSLSLDPYLILMKKACIPVIVALCDEAKNNGGTTLRGLSIAVNNMSDTTRMRFAHYSCEPKYFQHKLGLKYCTNDLIIHGSHFVFYASTNNPLAIFHEPAVDVDSESIELKITNEVVIKKDYTEIFKDIRENPNTLFILNFEIRLTRYRQLFFQGCLRNAKLKSLDLILR